MSKRNRAIFVRVNDEATLGRGATTASGLAKQIEAALAAVKDVKTITLATTSNVFWSLPFFFVHAETAKNDALGVATAALKFFDEVFSVGLARAEVNRSKFPWTPVHFVEDKSLWTRKNFRFLDTVVFGDGTRFEGVSLEEAENLDRELAKIFGATAKGSDLLMAQAFGA